MAKKNLPYFDDKSQLVKRCPVCKQTFLVTSEYFHKSKASTTGFASACKVCARERQNAYMDNPEARANVRAYNRHRRSLPGVRAAEYEQAKIYRKAHRDNAREHNTHYRSLEKNKKRKRDRQKERLDNNSGMRVSVNISSAIYRTLNGSKNGGHWETLVDFTLQELKKHLESKFQPEMTWENHGKKGWHIDHVIPKSAFNFKTPNDIDFKKCWCLENLQPMWAKENLRKSDKLEKPFQPSLAFGGAL
jgi:hypothetical protein